MEQGSFIKRAPNSRAKLSKDVSYSTLAESRAPKSLSRIEKPLEAIHKNNSLKIPYDQ
jgi:hypothetical protein